MDQRLLYDMVPQRRQYYPDSAMDKLPCINASEYHGGVLSIDTGFIRERMASSYLVEGGSEAAFIDTGANASVPRLLAVLERRGWKPADVRYVIATHVHLDHAGGAGRLMQELPEATFLVHPRGARHMIDPARLEASVRSVYGDEIYESNYGALVPIDAARTREMADGETIYLGDRELQFADTPGHARHHFCVWDERTRGWFSGDTFGLSYRELDTDRGPFMFPTTTPIEFDPPVLIDSVKCLLEKDPAWMYLTHYGRVGDIPRLAEQLIEGIEVLAGIGEQNEDSGNRGGKIRREFSEWLIDAVRAHGVSLPDDELQQVLESDIELNSQGVEVWLDRRKQRRALA
jgi:glyoxylase-like metal-dependent hydrolase (beta-lactamase superfamily II)